MKWSAALIFCCFISPIFAQTEEEEIKSITKVISDLTSDTPRMPFADVAQKYWLLDNMTTLSISFADGNYFQFNANDLLQQTLPPPENFARYSRENFKIRVVGNTAFENNSGHYEEIESGIVKYFFEFRVLEKVNGVWKVHLFSLHESTNNQH
jgi:hypothetical protein